jgi:hypothetical protein
VGPTGARTSVSGTVRFASFGVSVTPSTDSILFDSRGMASNLAGSRVYVLTRNGLKDSVCVSRLGQISRNC